MSATPRASRCPHCGGELTAHCIGATSCRWGLCHRCQVIVNSDGSRTIEMTRKESA